MDEFEIKVAGKFISIAGGVPATSWKFGLCVAAEELLAKIVVYRRMGLSGFKKQLNDEVCSELEQRARGLLDRAGVDPNRWIGSGL